MVVENSYLESEERETRFAWEKGNWVMLKSSRLDRMPDFCEILLFKQFLFAARVAGLSELTTFLLND